MIHDLRITVLVDNTARTADVLAEHGLALWIEADGRRILFDNGQGKVLHHNAERLGIPLDTCQQLPARGAACSVLHVDHFGNCVTDIDPEEVPAGGDWQVLAGSHTIIRRVTAYHEAATDEPVLLKGSDGRIEIAVRDGRAAATLQLVAGQSLTVESNLSRPPRRGKIR